MVKFLPGDYKHKESRCDLNIRQSVIQSQSIT